jgi:hypothetical protein
LPIYAPAADYAQQFLLRQVDGSYDLQPFDPEDVNAFGGGGDGDGGNEAPQFAMPGVAVPAPRQADEQLRARDFLLPRLQTPLTSLVTLAPSSNPRGVDGQSPPPVFAHAYYCWNLIATDIVVGDKDRADTYLQPDKPGGSIPQGKHTISWASIRQALMGHKGRELRDLLLFLRSGIDTARVHMSSPEGQFLLSTMSVQDQTAAAHSTTALAAIDGLLTANLAIDVWSSVTRELLDLYVKVHHLSTMATVAGRSKQRGEAPGLALLAEAERGLSGPTAALPATITVTKLSKAAVAQIEVAQTMQPEAYAAAVHEWISVLAARFPHVMHHYGDQIIEPVLGKTLAKRFTERNGGPGNVGDLLTTMGVSTAMPASVPTLGTPTTGPALATLDNSDLMAFVANVEVVMADPRAATMVAAHSPWTHDALEVRRLDVSDSDRPPTRFDSQQSHTVAWTLLRHEVMSYRNRPVIALLDFLRAELADLAGDRNSGGQATALLAEVDKIRNGGSAPLEVWQPALSQLVRHLMHLHQAAYISTFHDPTTAQASSHGEPQAMKALREAEEEIAVGGSCRSSKDYLIGHALKLLDLPGDPHAAWPQDAGAVQKSVGRWWRAIQRTFPQVFGGLRDDLREGMVGRLGTYPAATVRSWMP